MNIKKSMAASYLFLLLLFRHIFQSSSSSPTILLPLTHTLSQTHFTSPHHLLKTTSSTSAARHPHSTISVPISSGSDYTLTFSIGSSSPPQSISMYMDTGSDVVWFPCSPFKCILCEGENIPSLFNLTASSTATSLHCSSSHCSAIHSAAPTSDLCSISGCPLESIELSECPTSSTCPPFYYAYGDGSFVAKLYTDHLQIIPSSMKLHNFTFGCAHTALAEPIGVAGFGRGRLSLPAQLAGFSPQLGNQFSYCLISHSFKPERIRRPSPLILGRRHDPLNEVDGQETQTQKAEKLVYTPMLHNPKHPYLYSVGLTGISIGKKMITAPASMSRVDSMGNGGLVVDSGTTFTMLPKELYELVAAEFEEHVSSSGGVWKRLSQPESTTGLSHCYYLKDDVGRHGGSVPSLTLHFGGNGNGSSMKLPKRNYFYEFKAEGKKRVVGCLMLLKLMVGGSGDDEMEGGVSGILGNYFQQGFEVVYDLEMERVGFVRRRCDLLWDHLK